MVEGETRPNGQATLRGLTSGILQRVQWLQRAGLTFKGFRDLYEALGYSRTLSNADYRARYARGGIAGRIVDALPKATWRGEMWIEENEDPETVTKFEQAWLDLDQRLKVAAVLQRVDILSRLSTFAVLLIGAPGNFNEALPKGKPEQLVYLTPFAGGGGVSARTQQTTVGDSFVDATIEAYDEDAKSARFGLPVRYQLRRTTVGAAFNTESVHWTRVIHVAEGCLDDDVFGEPALQRPWNLLDDLEKVTGGGAEAFWIRANQGLHVDIDPAVKVDEAKMSLEGLKDQLDNYVHNQTRLLRTRGTRVDTLGSDVANFSNPADAILTQIAGTCGIPKRILTGSEMGELASSQDRDNWRDQINGRQTSYAGPYIVRPLVDRLIAYGYLPVPKKGAIAYEVKWPHVQTLTEAERADGAVKWASVNATQGEKVFTSEEIRDKWYEMSPLPEEAPPPVAPVPVPNVEKTPAQETPVDEKPVALSARVEEELVEILREAIEADNQDVVARIIGLGGAGSGDVSGHAFHGNQWTDVSGGGSPKQGSLPFHTPDASSRARGVLAVPPERFTNPPHEVAGPNLTPKDTPYIEPNYGARTSPDSPDISPLDRKAHDTLEKVETFEGDLKHLGGGINESHTLTTPDGQKFVYKPEIGQSQRGESPATAGEREVLTSRLDHEVGLNVVPDTVYGSHPERGVGSMQKKLLNATPDAGYETVPPKDRAKIAILDVLMGNQDRHRGNAMLSQDGSLVAVDHGYTFSTVEKGGYIRSFALLDLEPNDLPLIDQRRIAAKLYRLNLNKVWHGSKLSEREKSALRSRRDLLVERLNAGQLNHIKHDFTVSD